jgi:kynurenine formamidase
MASSSEISRRSLLAGTIGAAVALSGIPVGGEAVAQRNANVTKADLDRIFKEVSNWGRWGNDDQIGAVHLITPEKRKQAASLVREGISVSLCSKIDLEKAVGNNNPSIHVMNSTGEKPEAAAVGDTFTISPHGSGHAHFDSLCHVFYEGHMFNGYPQSLATSQGCSKLDVAAFRGGIVTRGILMDIARLKGVPYLEPEVVIYPEDLDAWEKQARVKVTSGDMIYLRTGRWARRAAKGPFDPNKITAGLHLSCARWLKQHDVAVLACDSISDIEPTPIEPFHIPFHILVINAMGMPLLDNCDLEELGETANRLHRWEFMAITAPLPIPGGTGSALDPLAMF